MRHISSALRPDIYQSVTNTIIAQIEAGGGPSEMPWHHDGVPIGRPGNALSNSFYRGINVIMLWIAAQIANYPTGQWATYRQWRELNAQVRKGERSTLVVFWKKLDTNDGEEREGDNQRGRRFVARGFSVFNAAQVDGYTLPKPSPLPDTERISRAEQFYAMLGIETRFGGNEAFYQPSKDTVQMPVFGKFRDPVAFYATLLHEGAHATAAPHRLGRDLSKRFGSEAYAMEEMIADWAACIACMTLELSSEPRPDHARYIASWLKVLKNDKRAVFMAASNAQEIVDWMWAQQPGDLYAAPTVLSCEL
jgi:antirestriction protein ArdC